MAVGEESRHHLYLRLEEVRGPEEATTLMEHLPPVGWSDVATRHDIAAIRADMHRQFGEVDRRFAEVDRRFDAIERRIDESVAATGNEIRGQLERELRLQTWRFITVVVALMGGVIAAVRL